MESSTRSPEIVELQEDFDSINLGGGSQRSNSTMAMNAVVTMRNRSALDDEINKLFEAINKRSSSRVSISSNHGDLTLGYAYKQAMKKPANSSVQHSPRISTEPVSLKQALRDLCISKASEIAAMKRPSKQCGSPGPSEAGRIKTLYDVVVVDDDKTGEPQGSNMPAANEGKRIAKKALLHSSVYKITSLSKSLDLASQSSPGSQGFTSQDQIAQSSSRFVNRSPRSVGFAHPSSRNENFQVQASKSLNQFSLPSPRLVVPKLAQNSIAAQRKVGLQHAKSNSQSTQYSPRTVDPGKENSDSTATAAKAEGSDIPAKSKTVSEPTALNVKRGGNSPKVTAVKTASTKVSRKTRYQTMSNDAVTAVHGNRAGKLSSSRVVKPALKSVGAKKNKQIQASTGSKPKEGTDIVGGNKAPLVCEKCQCAIKNPDEVTAIDALEATRSNGCPTANSTKSTKSRSKELSLSSKSSLGEFSTSTSNSEETIASRPSCGNKPHMSKDTRWNAIRRTKQRDGFLSLKHFNLLKKLGCGDIGTVYLAELVGSNCLFAIKVMDNEFLARRKKMPRAHTEREILKTLDHPFLPTLYTQFTTDNLSCLVMEYCPGGDLHVLRQKQPGRCFPEPAARFYVAEVLLALEYLHMLGIIYRDLKPENILVREDGHIMLTDFDLSLTCDVRPTLLESSVADVDPRISNPSKESKCIQPFCMKPASCFTPKSLPRRAKADVVVRSFPQLVAEPTEVRSNSFVGTHEYLAPEIIKGEGHGAAVDWWTFGIFLYELLYGRTPFKGCGNEETLANVVLQSLSFPDSPLVSFQARDLIRRLLAKEPESRLGSAKGAAEIKLHPFFEGLNWALIRCAVPPETPDCYDVGTPTFLHYDDKNTLTECKTTGRHLEFELF